MPIGTNDSIVKRGTTKTLEANGALIGNNAMGAADDAVYDIAVDGGGAPDAEFVLGFTFGTAPTVNTTIDLYAYEQDIDGTTDEQAPTATYKPRYVTSFTVNAVTTVQSVKRFVKDAPTKAFYSPYNNATGQSIAAGWTLKVTPRTLGPSP